MQASCPENILQLNIVTNYRLFNIARPTTNFLIYTHTSFKSFQLFYFAGFIFGLAMHLGLGTPLNWRAGHTLPNFWCWQHSWATLWFNTIFGPSAPKLNGPYVQNLTNTRPTRVQSRCGKKSQFFDDKLFGGPSRLSLFQSHHTCLKMKKKYWVSFRTALFHCLSSYFSFSSTTYNFISETKAI